MTIINTASLERKERAMRKESQFVLEVIRSANALDVKLFPELTDLLFRGYGITQAECAEITQTIEQEVIARHADNPVSLSALKRVKGEFVL